MWGYSGVVQAPDGTIWKIATSEKNDTGPDTREIDEVVLLIGVEAVKATRQFYVGRGLTVAKSFGGKYAEFAAGQSSPVKLALYKRRALAKDLGVPVDGTGSHRIVLGSTMRRFHRPGRVRLGDRRVARPHTEAQQARATVLKAVALCRGAGTAAPSPTRTATSGALATAPRNRPALRRVVVISCLTAAQVGVTLPRSSGKWRWSRWGSGSGHPEPGGTEPR